MAKTARGWFNSQSRLVQILLLLIPVVNWVTELCVRWSKALETKSVLDIVLALLVTFFGLVFGWVDLVWILIFNHLLLG